MLAFITALFLPVLPFLKAAIEIGTLVLTTAFQFVVWYLKEFWKGLGVVFHNLSVLTVILAAMLGSAYYFKTWDNDKVLQECIKTCPAPEPKPKTYYNPVKKEIYKAVGKDITVKPAPKPSKPSGFDPFRGN